MALKKAFRDKCLSNGPSTPVHAHDIHVRGRTQPFYFTVPSKLNSSYQKLIPIYRPWGTSKTTLPGSWVPNMFCPGTVSDM